MPEKQATPKIKLFSILGLLLATAMWGSGFLLQKLGMEEAELSAGALMFSRFAIATVMLFIIFSKRIRSTYVKGQWKSSTLVGIFLFLASLLQTIGLSETSPGNCAFITSSYVVMVPFIMWAVRKERPSWIILACAVMSFVGLGILSLTEGLHVGKGDALTLVCGVFFAIYIAGISLWAPDVDGVTLAFIMFATTTVLSFIYFLITDGDFSQFWNWTAVIYVAYLGLFFTGAAFTIQTVAQQYLSATMVGILLSMESAFGGLFSVLFGYDKLTARFVIGGLMMFGAVIIPEIYGYFMSKETA